MGTQWLRYNSSGDIHSFLGDSAKLLDEPFARKSMTGRGPTFGAFLLLLICNCTVWAAEECDSGKRKPSVIPHNQTHLEVSWKGVFQNCSDDHAVTIDVQKLESFENAEIFQAILSEQKYIVHRDPCRQHRILVKVNKSRVTNNYNNIIVNPGEMFGGFLKQELSKFCPTQNQPLKIPSALEKCVTNLSRTEQNLSNIFVTILNPDPTIVDQKIHLNITLENCLTAVRFNTKLTNKNFPNKKQNKSFPNKNMFIGAIAALAAVLVIVIVIVIVIVCKKYGKRDGKKSTTEEHSEMNDMYGQYEFDEEGGAIVRLGSVWVKDTSPQYGETEQLYRKLSQAQVKDNNEEYAEV